MRAASIAEKAGAHTLLCAIQLRLMVMLADSSGPGPAAALMPGLRRNIIRAGSPMMSSALHIFLGEMEAKRGLIGSARKHLKAGQTLLQAQPNLWLESMAENALMATCILASDCESGLKHGVEALRCARESGAAAMKRAALSNLGILHYLGGDFDKAIELLEIGRAHV